MTGKITRLMPATLSAWWLRSRRAVITGTACFLVARVVTEVVALTAAHGPAFVTLVRADPQTLLSVWDHWDASWYVRIATTGYTDNHLPAFSPLPPMIIAAVSRVAHLDPLLTGLILTFFAGTLACILLYRLVETELGPGPAGLTVFLLLSFPSALFLQTVYAEGPLLALSAGAFLAVRQHRLAVAGVLIGLAALTKTYAVILVVPLLWEHLEASGFHVSAALRGGARLVLPPIVAIGGWITYLAIRLHDPLLVVTSERFWGRQLAPPWVALTRGLGNINGHNLADATDVLCVVLLVAGAVYAWRRYRRSYALLLGLSVLVFTSSSVLTSTRRFTLVCFPLFIIAARLIAGRRWPERLWVAVSIPLAVYYIAEFATVRWAG